MLRKKEQLFSLTTLLLPLSIVVIIVLKLLAKYASGAQLCWLLGPVAWLSGILTGINFIFVPVEGFVAQYHNIVINNSCAGLNFMIIAYSLTCYILLKDIVFKKKTYRIKPFALWSFSFLASYLVTVLANSCRIALAINLLNFFKLTGLPAHSQFIHMLEGIFSYLCALIIYYFILNFIKRRYIHAHR